MEMETIKRAPEIGTECMKNYGVIGGYGLIALGLVLIASHPAVLLVLVAFVVMAGMDVRGRLRKISALQNGLAEAVWKAAHTITASALRHYAISDLEPLEGWELGTVLGMIGAQDASIPLATVRLNGGREIVASVFYDVQEARTYLVSADTGDNDLLDLVRRGR